MQQDVTPGITFQIPGSDAAAAVDPLIGLGFVFGPPHTVTTTLVDTFDGRLHRAQLRLELRRTEVLELVLSGAGSVTAHLAVDKVPRVLTDLPPGPFRSRLAELTDVRALLPQMRVRMRRSTGVWRDASGKLVAVAELNEDVHVVGRPSGECSPTIEIHEMAGYPKHVGQALDAMEAAGLERCDADTLERCAAAAGVDLAGFSASPTVPLDPTMAAIDGFRAVLANLAATIDANWSGTIDRIDTKFLHDLRIAVRRTRTVLAASKKVLPAEVREPASADFAWLAGTTSTPRDLDVYQLEWDHYTDPLGPDTASALEPVRELIDRRHAESHLDLEGAMRSERATELMADWRGWLDRPLGEQSESVELPRRASDPLGDVVAKRIDRAHRRLLADGRRIGPDTPAEKVHDLRKDAKKLRYLVECFGSLFPAKAMKRYVRQLKALQENLGEHQDAEVHIELLRSLTLELDEPGTTADTFVAIGQLTERLDRTRIAARTEFTERFADYDSRDTQRALDAMLDAISS